MLQPYIPNNLSVLLLSTHGLRMSEIEKFCHFLHRKMTRNVKGFKNINEYEFSFSCGFH